MTYYRIYPLDPAGHIAGVHEVDGPTDAEAIELARQKMAAGPGVEDWTGTRRVIRLDNAAAGSANK